MHACPRVREGMTWGFAGSKPGHVRPEADGMHDTSGAFDAPCLSSRGGRCVHSCAWTLADAWLSVTVILHMSWVSGDCLHVHGVLGPDMSARGRMAIQTCPPGGGWQTHVPSGAFRAPCLPHHWGPAHVLGAWGLPEVGSPAAASGVRPTWQWNMQGPLPPLTAYGPHNVWGNATLRITAWAAHRG